MGWSGPSAGVYLSAIATPMSDAGASLSAVSGTERSLQAGTAISVEYFTLIYSKVCSMSSVILTGYL